MKTVLIISGISGSGKTTLAETLGGTICTADDFFMVDGEYLFDPSKLGEAHGACFQKFKEALDREDPLVIMNNTTTHEDHAKPYVVAAQKAGYTVHWVVALPHHSGENVHGVPDSVLDKQALNIVSMVNRVHSGDIFNA